MRHLISLIALLLLSVQTLLAADENDMRFLLRLTTNESIYYLNITNGAAYLSETPQDFYLVEQEDGGFGIADTDHNYLVYQGADRWTMTTSTEPYSWKIAAMADGGYSITGENGLFGTNQHDGYSSGSPCYGDKTVENGFVHWSIVPVKNGNLPESELPVITVGYYGNTAFVDVPSTILDVTSTVDGADVVITSNTSTTEYAYRVTGASPDGSLTLVGAYKLSLWLDGVDLTNNDGPAIDVECGKRIAVELVDGTVNSLTDGAGGAHKAALYFSGHPEFEGSGTLSVKGNTKHAIGAKEYLQLKKSTGTINILGAVSDGIHCGKGKPNIEHNYFEMKGGVVNIANIGGDGIDADDYGAIRIKGGALTISLDGNDVDGLKADSVLSISGGDISIEVRGSDSNAMKASYQAEISGGRITAILTGDGSKGLKVRDASTTVAGGGNLHISGGEMEFYALGNKLIALDDTSKCMGVSVDLNLTQTAGDVVIYALGGGSKSYNMKGTESRSGGQFHRVKAPWMFNPFTFQHDMSAFVVVKAGDKLLTDYHDYAVGAFNGDECVGVALFRGSDYGELRIRSNATDADSITFRLYDDTLEEVFDLTADRDVVFEANGCYGMPSEPVVLGYEPPVRLRGDVNLDGNVDINDVVAVINVMAGSATFFDTADVNEDGKRDINDVVAIINIMAGGAES